MSRPDGSGGAGASIGTGAGIGTVATEIRRILAGATGQAEMLALPLDTSLFGAGVGLDSLTGTLLLRQLHRTFGVDVAAEDLNLDALATLGTLAAFVAARLSRAYPAANHGS